MQCLWKLDPIDIHLGRKLVCYRSSLAMLPKRMRHVKLLTSVYHSTCDQNFVVPSQFLIWSNEFLGYKDFETSHSLEWKQPIFLRASSEQFLGAIRWAQQPSIMLVIGGPGQQFNPYNNEAAMALNGMFPDCQDRVVELLMKHNQYQNPSDTNQSVLIDEGQGRMRSWQPEYQTTQQQIKSLQAYQSPNLALRRRAEPTSREILQMETGWSVASAFISQNPVEGSTVFRRINAWKLVCPSYEHVYELPDLIVDNCTSYLEEVGVTGPALRSVLLGIRAFPLFGHFRERLMTRWNLAASAFGVDDLKYGWNPMATRLQQLLQAKQPSLLIDLEDFPNVEFILVSDSKHG